MEVAGTTSWRFAESAHDDVPHVALFVRDAVGLPVPPGPAVPPRLAGPVPDRRDLLSEQEREDAGRHWAGWWTAVVASQVQAQAAPAQRSARELREPAGCPPDFAALADRPALHRAVVATFPESHRWVNGLRRGGRGGRGGGCFPYRLVRQVAEDVAFDRSVDVGAVRASAVVLEVEGSWWHLAAPGTVLCSVTAAAEPVSAQAVLRRAFESGLGQEPHRRPGRG